MREFVRGGGFGIDCTWMKKRSLVWGLGNAMNARLGSVLRVKFCGWLRGQGRPWSPGAVLSFWRVCVCLCVCAFMHTFLYAEANGQ